MKKNLYVMYAIELLQGMVFYGPIATLYRQAQGVTVFEITVIESISTDWLTFTAWGKTAEFVSRYFRKGSAAVVHSRCQTRQYEDKNGNNRTAIEFVVDNIYFAGPKQDNQQGTVDDGGTNPPPATYRNQQPQPQQMGFATQSQRQQWQGAADHPGNVQVSQSFSQGSDDDFSVLDDADDLPF